MPSVRTRWNNTDLAEIPLHVWMGEDYYEQDHGHYKDPRFFFRWLFWSWLLSGGSANYCGRWGPIDPYSMTGKPDRPWQGIDRKTIYTGEQLVGLDSIPYLAGYLRDRNLDLGLFLPTTHASKILMEGRVLTPQTHGARQERIPDLSPQRDRRRKAARVDKSKTARMRINLSDAPGHFQVEWFRAFDGVTTPGEMTGGGAPREFVAPWKGEDVVLRLCTRPVNEPGVGAMRIHVFWLLGINLALPALSAAVVEVVKETTGQAVQSAIDTCAAAGGGVVDLPAGLYDRPIGIPK